jgi:threonine dehydrogenase-like Zn-dependent dehydrogenase
MAGPAWACSAGVTAAHRGRAVPGVALGRQPGVRRRVLSGLARKLDDLLPAVLDGTIQPGRVLNRTVTLDAAPSAYHAMADREALKVMITP